VILAFDVTFALHYDPGANRISGARRGQKISRHAQQRNHGEVNQLKPRSKAKPMSTPRPRY
jgi:hypothetical protein